jgi:putative hydrolase
MPVIRDQWVFGGALASACGVCPTACSRRRADETYGPLMRRGYALLVDPIDWRTAQRIGERIAGAPMPGGVKASAVEPRAYDFAHRVSVYSGLQTPDSLPPIEAVDRAAWIAANLSTMRPMLAGLSERLGDGAGPLAGPLRSASGFLLGAQVGALTGVLSQRVLGQYDLALLDDTVQPRLLLLAPNLAIAARNLSVDRDELVLWVAIHEITHAVQFTAVPWLRGHIGGMLRELIDGLQVSLGGEDRGEDRGEGSGDGSSSGNVGGWRERIKVPDPAELRELAERARRGELLRLTLGEDRWALVERMQAAMSLIEGHAEHTMDAIGEEVLPSLPRLRAAMTRRRESRGLPWRVLERLLGLEMKMRQYEVGRRFCDGVVAKGGTAALARVWNGPEQLPSNDELADPGLWLARTGVPAGA